MSDAPAPPRSHREAAVDLLRGAVMVVMVLDHARDFMSGFGDATDLATTTPQLFATRWVTHYCAPAFVFLAGSSAYLYGARRTPAERSRFLLTRGLFLVALELTVVRLAWVPEPFYIWTLLQVIWAIGWAMVLLAALSRLSPRWVLAVGLVIVCGHDALTPIDAEDLGAAGWLFTLLFEPAILTPAPGHTFMAAYAIVPWTGVMACGYAFGVWLARPTSEWSPLALRLGAAITAAFVVLRLVNLYGDPVPFRAWPSAWQTVAAFVNCEKYPPSLQVLAMTLGPLLVALALLARADVERAPWRWLLVFGRVPLFFYVAHLYLLRPIGIVAAYARWGMDAFEPPPGHALAPELPLAVSYVAWALAVLVLYLPSRWFARKKATSSAWWLRYL